MRTNKIRTARNTIIIGMFLLHAIATAGWTGELAAWGDDNYGQVSGIPAGNDFDAVAAGGMHSVALKTDGSLIAWGYDGGGQVSGTPTGNNFEAIAAGGNHNVALKTDGSLVAWGYDNNGQVSDSPAGNVFKAIVAGKAHNVALKEDGSLVAWGSDSYGQVSDAPSGNDFTAVAAGEYHSLALKTDGSLVAWGYDSNGQVSNTPSGNDFIAIAAGDRHNVALKLDGSLIAWGNDVVGQVSKTPTGNDFTAIAAGKVHSVALKTDGSLVAWGSDSYGQVSEIPIGNDLTAVVAGSYYNVAIRDTQITPTYTLITNVSPSGSGPVTKNPDKSSYSYNESVQLTATANSGYTFSNWSGDASGSTNPVTIIMNSNKAVTANFIASKPTVSITATDASASEPANNGSFTVSRTGATSVSLRVYYSTSVSTATSGTDYAALPGYVDIPAGQSSAVISVVVIDDTTIENSEMVQLTISSNAAYTIGSPSSAAVTIADNDQPVDKPVVTITAPDASAGEPSNHGYFVVSRTGATSVSLRVYYINSGSTASPGTDYIALPSYVDIPSGQSSASMPVIVIDDTTVENTETVQLTIWALSTYTVGSPSSATVTIADNDGVPVDKPVVTITAPDASAGEPSNNGSFTVSRTGTTVGSLRVYYSTNGTASSGTDYTALPGYVDIPAGQSSANITVAVIDDITMENSETVQLTISSNAAYTIGSPSSAAVTIADNEQPEVKPVVTITSPDASAGEPADDGSFMVSRTGATSVSLRVYYSTSGSTAFSGTDYAALPGYVDIPSGQSSAAIYIVVINDNTIENSETVRLTISSNTAYTIGSPSYATVTITDDDTSSPVVDMMADTLTFFYLSVDDGSLQGVGTGRGRKALASMQNLLETAYALIVDGYYDDACVQLTDALSRCDGDNYIPDYVSGAATATLAGMIQEVINGLGCP
jgi:hypothetical protein